eukprot:COSAG06_NODE_27883_length_584_cov_2.884536_1_plen_46_part_10
MTVVQYYRHQCVTVLVRDRTEVGVRPIVHHFEERLEVGLVEATTDR